MQKSGQLHTLATLATTIKTVDRGGAGPRADLDVRRRKHLLPPPGIEPRSLDRPARILVLQRNGGRAQNSLNAVCIFVAPWPKSFLED